MDEKFPNNKNKAFKEEERSKRLPSDLLQEQ